MTASDDDRTRSYADKNSLLNKIRRRVVASLRAKSTRRDEFDPKSYGCRDADELFGASDAAHEPAASNSYGQAYATIAHHDEEHVQPPVEREQSRDEDFAGGSFNPGATPGKHRVYDWYSMVNQAGTVRGPANRSALRPGSRIEARQTGALGSPRSLGEQVRERLYGHVGIDAAVIDIEIDNIDVTLSGKVASLRAKRVAENCAASVKGVGKIVNRLTIDRSVIWPDRD
jgi:hypothetical protein